MRTQKFGGTSMGSVEAIRKVMDIIRATPDVEAVVVSAMTGVTNSLLVLLASAENGSAKEIETGIEALIEKHVAASRELVADVKCFADTEKYVRTVLEDLRTFLKSLMLVGEVTPKSRDAVLAVGEQLSSRMLASALSSNGRPAEQVDLRLAIPAKYKAANEAFYVDAEKLFGKLFTAVNKRGRLPVGTGYFGRVPGGMLSAVGRGYSDFCAALVAAGMKSKQLEIWTDVSGVYSADPRKVKTATVLTSLSFEAAAELAHFGAKVIHPQSIHPAVRAQIPVWIKNTFAPEDRGTEVLANPQIQDRSVDSVTSKKGMAVFHVVSLRKILQQEFLSGIFTEFANAGIPVDVVSTSEVSVSLVVDDVPELVAIAKELAGFARVTIRPDKAIICVVGDGMRHRPGTAGELFTVLGETGINVEQISQGASERNITCVVDAGRADDAVAAVHAHFLG